MKKLVFILLITLSYASYADSTCTQRGKKIICKEYTNQHDEEWEQIDYKAAGQGLRNILRWLNENSTSNTNTKTNSSNSNSYKPSNVSKFIGSSNEQLTNYSIPDNAYRTKGTWKCLSSYIQSGNRCIVKGYNTPKNAYILNGVLKCKAGYKMSGSSCITDIYIPLNANASGSGWKCKFGYYKYSNSCQKLPANSYAPLSGGWECNHLFTKSGNKCFEEDKIEESIETSQEDSSNYLEKIKQAKNLLDSGVITQDEFSEIKKRIIDNI